MKELSRVQLAMIKAMLDNADENGYWDDTPQGNVYKFEYKSLCKNVNNAINDKGDTDEDMLNLYEIIYRDVNDKGHYNSH